ncbi:hypothetical protein EOL96_03780 [Candidatus Saccharibacteria bacterium]|nr:hypothetical protein [Candidatus Saccharibacteria bacterium]
MITAEIYQIIAVTSLVFSSILGIAAVAIAPQGKGSSISGSIASHKLLYLVSGVTITILATLFCLSVVHWYMPVYSMPDYTVVLAVICVIFALPIAWAPADTAKSHRLHSLHFAAGQVLGIALLMILATALYSKPSAISPITQIVLYFTLGYSVLCYILYLTVPYLKKYFLYFEVSFLAALLLSFLLLALRV